MDTYAERLQTFVGHWDEHMTAARQLAAIGHVADRPPLEAIEAGSRCISCHTFVEKERSIRALGDVPLNFASYKEEFANFNFHRAECLRLQVRIPIEPQALLAGLYGGRFDNLRSTWERRSSTSRSAHVPMAKALQSSSLFSLPTEIRLQIYAMVLPSFSDETEIMQLHNESARMITRQGYEKTGPRDVTKANILRTCRMVNDEAMDLIYSHTTFKFSSTKAMYLFLRSIGKPGRALIRSIHINCGQREDAIAFAMLASCERLRAIEISLNRPHLLYSRAPPIWLVDGVSTLLALSGLEKVTFYRGDIPRVLTHDRPDAALIREQLMRPRGTPGDDSLLRERLDFDDVRQHERTYAVKYAELRKAHAF